VVEDNRDAARSLELLLKLIGCEVRVAFDGSSALALLPEFTPRAAILDIGLPDFDGYELARRIRDQRLPAPVTLIALTGWGEEEDRRNSAEAGFDHHLTKPVRFEELSELLERLKRR